MEVEIAGGRINRVNAADGQVEVGREDGALQGDAVPDFPVVLPGKVDVDDAAGPVLLPGCKLVGRHALVCGHVEVLFGISGELGKKVFRFVVFVLAAKPGHGDHVDNARHGTHFVAIVDGKEVGERDLVPGHDAQCGIGSALVNVKAAPDGQHDAEQEQGERDAGNRQQAAAFVAEGGLGDKAGEGHNKNILHCDRFGNASVIDVTCGNPQLRPELRMNFTRP